jgi:glutamyl-tRNA synthetase
VARTLPFLVADLEARRERGEVVRIPTEDDLQALLPLVRERLPLLSAIGPLVDFLFAEELQVDPAQLVPKRWEVATTLEGLKEARRVIAEVGEVSFEADALEARLRALCEVRGWRAGDLFMGIRVAVTGRTATPPLFDTLVVLGYTRTLERLDAARALLEESEAGVHG